MFRQGVIKYAQEKARGTWDRGMRERRKWKKMRTYQLVWDCAKSEEGKSSGKKTMMSFKKQTAT